MRSYRVLALGVLLVLAGCSGLSPDAGAPDRSPYGVDDELEPALADEANGSDGAPPERLAPGVTADGVQNASVLVDNHYDALEAAAGNGTYTVAAQGIGVTENGSRALTIDGSFFVAAPGRWLRTIATAEPPGSEPTTTATWVEDDRSLYRTERPNGTVHYREVSFSPSRPLERSLLSTLSRATNATVEARPVNASTWYRVTANVSDVDAVRRLSFDVREDGLVQRVSYTSETTHRPNATAVEHDIRFDPTGPDSLERPDWYDEALEEGDGGPPNEGEPDDETPTDDESDGDEGGDEDQSGDEDDETDAPDDDGATEGDGDEADGGE